MGKDSTKQNENIYFKCRKEASIWDERLCSRESAADLLGVSVSSLADYELGLTKVVPVDKVVLMADLYRSPQLKTMYCKNACPIGECLTVATEILGIETMLEGCEDYEKYAAIYRKIQSSKRFNAFNTPVEMTEDEFYKRIGMVLTAHDNPEREPYFKTKADAFAYGKKALDNFAKYGYVDWYDWCVDNWGTKWNACNTIIHGNEVWFDTAWSPAIPIVKKLAELHPDCNFLLEYADEEKGTLVGWIDIDNELKESTENLYTNFSKEAYEQAFMLLGGREDYKYNEDTGTYDYIE